MNKSLWLTLPLAGLLWPMSLPTASAQPPGQYVPRPVLLQKDLPPTPPRPADDPAARRNESHLHIPSPVGDPEQAQKFLLQRLHRAEDLSKLQKLLQDPALQDLARAIARDPGKFGVTQDDLARLTGGKGPGSIRPDLSDPRWRDLLGQVIKAQESGDVDPDATIAPEELAKWKDLLKRLPEDDPLPNTPPSDPDRPTDTIRLDQPPDQKPPVSDGPGGILSPPDRKDVPNGQQPDPFNAGSAGAGDKSDSNRWLLDALDRYGKDNPLLKEPALRQALRDFNRNLAGQGGPSLSHDPGQLRERIPALGKYIHLDQLSKINAPRWGKSWLPSAPTLRAPRNNGLAATSGSSGRVAQGLAGNSGPERGSPWDILLWVLLILGVAVLLWAFFLRKRGQAPAPDSGDWLGPWPVAPGAVRTRAELVRAFEYLSLLVLGPGARHWNHLDIATRMAGLGRMPEPVAIDAEERRDAVAQLALLYEHARYAPPDDVLPEAELAAARRHLCLLAGVAPA